MSGFGGRKEADERGEGAGSKSQMVGGEANQASSFGRRKERPDADLMRVLNTGSAGASQRTPRAVSPPLD
jgi:hypothetical protein